MTTIFDLNYDHNKDNPKKHSSGSLLQFFSNPDLLQYLSSINWEKADITKGLGLLYLYNGPLLKWMETCSVDDFSNYLKLKVLQRFQEATKTVHHLWVDCKAFEELNTFLHSDSYSEGTPQDALFERIDHLFHSMTKKMEETPVIWEHISNRRSKELFSSKLGICWFDATNFSQNDAKEPSFVEEWYEWASLTDQEVANGNVFSMLEKNLFYCFAQVRVVFSKQSIRNRLIRAVQRIFKWARLCLQQGVPLDPSEARKESFEEFGDISMEDKEILFRLLKDLFHSAFLCFEDRIKNAIMSVPDTVVDLLLSRIKLNNSSTPLKLNISELRKQIMDSIEKVKSVLSSLDVLKIAENKLTEEEKKELTTRLKEESISIVPAQLKVFLPSNQTESTVSSYSP